MYKKWQVDLPDVYLMYFLQEKKDLYAIRVRDPRRVL